MEEAFPSTAGIQKKGAAEGLDAAAVEFITAAGLTPAGKVWLRDGRSGQQFEHPVTVGVIYMLKLSTPGRRQDSRAFDRTVLARDAAAARR